MSRKPLRITEPTAEGDLGPPPAPGAGKLEAGWSGVFWVSAGAAEAEDILPTFEAWSSGRFAVSRCSAGAHALQRDAAMLRSGTFDGVGLCLVEGGNCRLRAGGLDANIAAGEVLTLDMSRTATLELTPEAASVPIRMIALWLPRASFGIDEARTGIVSDSLAGDTPTGAMLASQLRILSERTRDADADEFDLLCENVAALAAKALARSARQRRPVESPLETFMTIRRFIDRNLAAPKLGPDMVARSFGLSRSTLYRLFEPVGGLSAYVRSRRMERAFEEITAAARANHRIGPIAFALGFKNFSAFSRAFRDVYGMSPGQARKAALNAETPTRRSPPEAESLSPLCLWLRDLRK